MFISPVSLPNPRPSGFEAVWPRHHFMSKRTCYEVVRDLQAKATQGFSMFCSSSGKNDSNLPKIPSLPFFEKFQFS